jgi:4-amino-4-deoxy-L-arabinose transferase-like glycosyltransferase
VAERRDRLYLAVVAGGAALLYLLYLGGPSLWDTDEGMHAAIARHIVTSGDWLVPRFNGTPFFDKPILFNWATAVSFLVLGFTEFAARLPAALSAVGSVVVTYLLGRALYDRTVGLLAAVVMATSLEVLIVGRAVQYDIPFTFLTTLALYGYVRGVRSAVPNSRWHLLFYVAAALAVLVKGPIGLVIPGLVIGLQVLSTRRFASLLQMRLVSGTVIFLVIAVPWFVLMERAEPGYLRYFLGSQNFGNFVGSSAGLRPVHPQPFYFYAGTLLLAMFPWAIVLPRALVNGFKAERGSGGDLRLFAFVWVLGVFVFFSLASSKLMTYMLPMFPAAALMLGRYWAVLWQDSRLSGRRGPALEIGLLCGLLAIGAAYLAVAPAVGDDWPVRYGIEPADIRNLCIVLTALAGLACALLLRAKPLLGFGSLAAMGPAFLFFFVFVLAPKMDEHWSSKELALDLDQRLAPGEELHFYGQLMDSAIFYAGRDAIEFDNSAELDDYLTSDHQVFVLIRDKAATESARFRGNYRIVRTAGNKAIVTNPGASLAESGGASRAQEPSPPSR